MYNKGRPDGVDTTHLCDIIIGGGPLAAEHVIKIRDIFPGTSTALIFGQTELAGTGFCFYPNRREDLLAMCGKPGSCGKPVPDSISKVS